MSVGNTTAVGNYLRSSSNITSFGLFTASGWFYVSALPVSGYSYPLGIGIDGTHFCNPRISTAGAITVLTGGGSTSTGVTVAPGDWFYMGVVQNGTSGSLYLSKNNAASTFTAFTADSSASANPIIYLANYVGTSEYAALYVDNARIWNSALTQANLDAEKNAPTAVITSNNLRDSALPDTSHVTGWTVTGTLTNGTNDPYNSSTGTSAVTEGADVSAASGAVLVSGTSTTTDGADISAGSAGALIVGTSATTDGADASAASGSYVSSTANWPRIGNYSIGSSFNWENAAVETMCKRCVAVIHSGWDGWQSGHTPMATWQAAVRTGSVKNVAPVFFYYVDINFQTSTSANNGIINPATSVGWWLNNAAGATVTTSYFGTARMLNIFPGGATKPSGVGSGLSGYQYLVQWYCDFIFNGNSGGYALSTNTANSNQDGIYFDDMMPNLGNQYTSWVSGLGGTDFDRDSVADPWGTGTGTSFTAAHRAAQVGVYNYFKSVKPGKLTAANMANWYGSYKTAMGDFIGIHDCGVMEHALGNLSYDTEAGAASELIAKYQWTEDALIGLKYTIVCHDGVAANGSDGRDATAYRAQRYGQAFTYVIGDGAYFPTGSYSPSFDATLLFDEMFGGSLANYNWLGQPIDARQTTAWSNGVYRRRFTNGWVLWNPRGSGSRTVALGTTLTRLTGTQDPTTNSGASVTSVTLADRDGLFLISTTANTSVTTDGADVSSASGTTSVTGTSAKTDGADVSAASGGVLVTGTSVTSDGADEVLASDGGLVVLVSSTEDGADVSVASGDLAAGSSVVSGSSDTEDGADISETQITGSGAIPMQITVYSQLSRNQIVEKSSFHAFIKFYDDSVYPWVAATPTTVDYRVDCESTGAVMRDWTSLTPAATINLIVTSSDNAIISNVNRIERRVLTVRCDDGLDTQESKDFRWTVKNLQGQY